MNVQCTKTWVSPRDRSACHLSTTKPFPSSTRWLFVWNYFLWSRNGPAVLVPPTTTRIPGRFNRTGTNVAVVISWMSRPAWRTGRMSDIISFYGTWPISFVGIVSDIKQILTRTIHAAACCGLSSDNREYLIRHSSWQPLPRSKLPLDCHDNANIAVLLAPGTLSPNLTMACSYSCCIAPKGSEVLQVFLLQLPTAT